MKFGVLLSLLACAAAATFGGAQSIAGQATTKRMSYMPKKGEAVLDLAVEGRGDIYIQLNTAAAPKTCEHIESLVKSGFYDGQRFFKVLTSPRPYLIQLGDPSTRDTKADTSNVGSGKSGAGVPYEDTGAAYVAGAVVLATRKGEKDSGDSQFYILLDDYNKLLQGTGTVFGHVVFGMDVVSRVRLGDRVSTVRILTG